MFLLFADACSTYPQHVPAGVGVCPVALWVLHACCTDRAAPLRPDVHSVVSTRPSSRLLYNSE